MKNRYILDTNILIHLERESSPYHEIVQQKLSNLDENSEIGISIITLYEIKFGLYNSKNKNTKQGILTTISLIEEFFEIYPLDKSESDIFGELKAEYKTKFNINKQNIKKDTSDLMIASTAIAKNAILISADNIFDNIAKIRNDFYFENWTKNF